MNAIRLLLVLQLASPPQASAHPNLSSLPAGTVVRRAATYHVEDPSGAPVLEISYQGELAREHSGDVYVLRTPSADLFTLRVDRQEKPHSIEASLEFPDQRRLVFQGGENSRITNKQTGRSELGMRDSQFVFNKKTFPFDLSKPFKPQFESAEGQEFRSALPPEAVEVMRALWNVREGLFDQAMGGMPTIFALLFLGEEDEKTLPQNEKGWTLKTIQESRRNLTTPEKLKD